MYVCTYNAHILIVHIAFICWMNCYLNHSLYTLYILDDVKNFQFLKGNFQAIPIMNHYRDS